jgi:hypothetical protein
MVCRQSRNNGRTALDSASDSHCVVTASLFTGRHAAHVRLIPMGVGYRYAGHGIWLDGFRENALLNFGKHAQVACSIARS